MAYMLSALMLSPDCPSVRMSVRRLGQ